MICSGESCTHKDEHYSIGAPAAWRPHSRMTLLRLGDPFLAQSHFRPPMQGTRDRAFSLESWQRRNQLYLNLIHYRSHLGRSAKLQILWMVIDIVLAANYCFLHLFKRTYHKQQIET